MPPPPRSARAASTAADSVGLDLRGIQLEPLERGAPGAKLREEPRLLRGAGARRLEHALERCAGHERDAVGVAYDPVAALHGYSGHARRSAAGAGSLLARAAQHHAGREDREA